MHRAAHHSVTTDVLALVVIVLFAAGWFARRMWQAHDDVRSLRQRLANAQRARWRAGWRVALVGFFVLTMWMVWWRANGG